MKKIDNNKIKSIICIKNFKILKMRLIILESKVGLYNFDIIKSKKNYLIYLIKKINKKIFNLKNQKPIIILVK